MITPSERRVRVNGDVRDDARELEPIARRDGLESHKESIALDVRRHFRIAVWIRIEQIEWRVKPLTVARLISKCTAR